MRFSKWHALGNAYLLLERADLESPLEPDDVRRLCDTHRGVGADGVLEVVEIRGPEAEIVVWNPDGPPPSSPETARGSPRCGSRGGVASPSRG